MSANDLTLSGDAADAAQPAGRGTQPGTRIGDFIVERQLGAGAMGEVLLAHHVDDGQRVALKLIARRFSGEDSFLQRFEREIDALVRIEHPHIARAIAYGVHGELPFLAMEYVEGQDLADLIDERGPLHESDVLMIAMQVGKGLAHVHMEAGMVHRDVKPSNILIAYAGQPAIGRVLGDKGRVKLIDFGLAKSIDGEQQRLTMTGMIMGTPNYMAPEQVRGEVAIDYRVDIYALGASMYHLLTGQLPFPGASPALVMTGHLTRPVPDPGDLVPSLDPATRALVRTAMAKDPKDRFTDWRAFIVACERALSAKGDRESSQVRILRRPRDASTQTPVTQFVVRSRPSQTAPTELLPNKPSPQAPLPVLPVGRTIPTPPSRHLTPTPDAAPMVQAPLQSAVGGGASGTPALRQVLTGKIQRIQDTSRTYRRQQAEADADAIEPIRPEPLPPIEPPPATWPGLLPLALVIGAGLAVLILALLLRG